MDIFEKAKITLRNQILLKRDKIKRDLNAMRLKSTGKDIFHYVDVLNDSFSFDWELSDYTYTASAISLEDIETYRFHSVPPDYGDKYLETKKDPELVSGLFF